MKAQRSYETSEIFTSQRPVTSQKTSSSSKTSRHASPLPLKHQNPDSTHLTKICFLSRKQNGAWQIYNWAIQADGIYSFSAQTQLRHRSRKLFTSLSVSHICLCLSHRHFPINKTALSSCLPFPVQSLMRLASLSLCSHHACDTTPRQSNPVPSSQPHSARPYSTVLSSTAGSMAAESSL
jgi:hypothetical protein